MYKSDVDCTYGEGRYVILASALVTGDGVSVTICGGEKPHVGGMAMSVPRDGLQKIPPVCDTWIVPRPHHRDAELASMVSTMICQATGFCTAVVAGVHIDGAEPREIDILMENSQAVTRLLIDRIRTIMER